MTLIFHRLLNRHLYRIIKGHICLEYGFKKHLSCRQKFPLAIFLRFKEALGALTLIIHTVGSRWLRCSLCGLLTHVLLAQDPSEHRGKWNGAHPLVPPFKTKQADRGQHGQKETWGLFHCDPWQLDLSNQIRFSDMHCHCKHVLLKRIVKIFKWLSFKTKVTLPEETSLATEIEFDANRW